jgi:hypothetical protein
MRRRLEKFLALPGEEKRLFLEAWVTLGVMRAAILTVSFKRLTRSLDHSLQGRETQFPNEEEKKRAAMIGRAIIRAAAHTPWESACLAQALTARRMLQRRGIPGVFFLGVSKEGSEREMNAHAWSRCGEISVTGGEGEGRFVVLSVFEWKGNGKK